MHDLLFVYGTLRSAFDNPWARLLREDAELLGAATVRGSIYRVGHYPGYRPDPDGVVHGELYRLPEPDAILTALDEYEGPEFTRILTSAEHKGVPVNVWIYRFDAALPSDSLIAFGDFCA